MRGSSTRRARQMKTRQQRDPDQQRDVDGCVPDTAVSGDLGQAEGEQRHPRRGQQQAYPVEPVIIGRPAVGQ